MPTVEIAPPGAAGTEMRAAAGGAGGAAASAEKLALPPGHVEDARGRILQWSRLGYLDQMRLAEIAGPTTSKNEAWMLPAMVAFSVTAIGGERVAKPVSRMQLDAMIQRLGDDGMDALVSAIFPQGEAEPDEAPVASEVERAKN